ncbi:MAG: pyridoxamine 5'-phosphate oxidase family protein [Ktedonobacteraceae bacterium]
MAPCGRPFPIFCTFRTFYTYKIRDDSWWKPILKVWFANGENDPNLALLKVDATQAEYWDSPSSKMVQVVLMAKAAVTDSQDTLGENKKVNIS